MSSATNIAYWSNRFCDHKFLDSYLCVYKLFDIAQALAHQQALDDAWGRAIELLQLDLFDDRNWVYCHGIFEVLFVYLLVRILFVLLFLLLFGFLCGVGSFLDFIQRILGIR